MKESTPKSIALAVRAHAGQPPAAPASPLESDIAYAAAQACDVHTAIRCEDAKALLKKIEWQRECLQLIADGSTPARAIARMGLAGKVR